MTDVSEDFSIDAKDLDVSDEALETAAIVGERPEHTWTFTHGGCCV